MKNRILTAKLSRCSAVRTKQAVRSLSLMKKCMRTTRRLGNMDFVLHESKSLLSEIKSYRWKLLLSLLLSLLLLCAAAMLCAAAGRNPRGSCRRGAEHSYFLRARFLPSLLTLPHSCRAASALPKIRSISMKNSGQSD